LLSSEWTHSYANFQISDGVGGNAKAQAAAVFVTPFDGVDLSTVCETERDAVEAMRKAAEDAEKEEFDPQIAAASGATGTSCLIALFSNRLLTSFLSSGCSLCWQDEE
jgi:hypothetical protein